MNPLYGRALDCVAGRRILAAGGCRAGYESRLHMLFSRCCTTAVVAAGGGDNFDDDDHDDDDNDTVYSLTTVSQYLRVFYCRQKKHEELFITFAENGLFCLCLFVLLMNSAPLLKPRRLYNNVE